MLCPPFANVPPYHLHHQTRKLGLSKDGGLTMLRLDLELTSPCLWVPLYVSDTMGGLITIMSNLVTTMDTLITIIGGLVAIVDIDFIQPHDPLSYTQQSSSIDKQAM
jgi:hypothetical protein